MTKLLRPYDAIQMCILAKTGVLEGRSRPNITKPNTTKRTTTRDEDQENENRLIGGRLIEKELKTKLTLRSPEKEETPEN